MTIEFGWGILPLIITIAAFVTAKISTPPQQQGGYIPDMIASLIGVGFKLIATIIISLMAWLIYALAT